MSIEELKQFIIDRIQYYQEYGFAERDATEMAKADLLDEIGGQNGNSDI